MGGMKANCRTTKRHIIMNEDTNNMESRRAYRFRVYPDAKRQSEIDLQLILSKNLYNKLLEKTIDLHRADPKSKLNMSSLNKIMKESISENKDFLKLYSQTRQDIFIRILKAYQNFFRRAVTYTGWKNSIGIYYILHWTIQMAASQNRRD